MKVDLNTLFTGNVEFSPDSDEKSTLTLLPTSRGVSFFVDASGKPIQLLLCGNIRQMVRARLFSANEKDSPSRKVKLSQITQKIYFLSCHSQFRSYLHLQRLAQTIFPENPSEAVELPSLNIVRINTESKWPQFSISGKITNKSGVVNIAPFPSRKSAALYIETLREIFGLCKNTIAIDSPEKAKSCPYLQMESCPAPCVGKQSYEEYIETINLACKVAIGNSEIACEYLESKMQEAAQILDFETAAKHKNLQEKISILNYSDYRWINDVRNFELLHIDKSAKIKIKGERKKSQGYCCFYFKDGKIFELKDFMLESLDKVLPEIEKIRSIDSSINANSQDEFTLISYFLNRSSKSGLWIDCANQLPEEDFLYKQIESLD